MEPSDLLWLLMGKLASSMRSELEGLMEPCGNTGS